MIKLYQVSRLIKRNRNGGPPHSIVIAKDSYVPGPLFIVSGPIQGSYAENMHLSMHRVHSKLAVVSIHFGNPASFHSARLNPGHPCLGYASGMPRAQTAQLTYPSPPSPQHTGTNQARPQIPIHTHPNPTAPPAATPQHHPSWA